MENQPKHENQQAESSTESDQVGNDPSTMGLKDSLEKQYLKIKEHAETYPYVWASYIVVYGGFALWTAYRWTKLRKTEDRVRTLQERLRKLVEEEESANSTKVVEKGSTSSDKHSKRIIRRTILRRSHLFSGKEDQEERKILDLNVEHSLVQRDCKQCDQYSSFVQLKAMVLDSILSSPHRRSPSFRRQFPRDELDLLPITILILERYVPSKAVGMKVGRGMGYKKINPKRHGIKKVEKVKSRAIPACSHPTTPNIRVLSSLVVVFVCALT
ncbi:hypothetical protein VNO77_19562 [Canavalia gladiata]|uniref:Transmembrane protein n=1 Tax=Canavalia gladiata TaxID=3824 RepID=A0AAN9QPR2_CANGL